MPTSLSARHRWARTLLALIAVVALAAPAAAATRLFVVANGEGKIIEINPTTGREIGSVATQGFGNNPGLAFNGSELFYTDDLLPTIHVYSLGGALLRQLVKPGDRGAGLGVSTSSLYVVGSDDDQILAVSTVNGAVQSSFFVPGAKQALTYAGSRNSLFVRLGDAVEVAETDLDGTVLNVFDGPTTLTGLAFSSSANRLYGVVSGLLYALDPNNGTTLPGYPVQITDAGGNPRSFTGGAAADEIAAATPLTTRDAAFWRKYPTVINGTFDGPSGSPSFLPIDFCGGRIRLACEAVVLMSLPGGGILQFTREAITATLNCRAFGSCTADVLDIIKTGSDACAAHKSRFNYGAAGAALAAFNRSGANRPLPFDPGRAQPLYCLLSFK